MCAGGGSGFRDREDRLRGHSKCVNCIDLNCWRVCVIHVCLCVIHVCACTYTYTQRYTIANTIAYLFLWSLLIMFQNWARLALSIHWARLALSTHLPRLQDPSLVEWLLAALPPFQDCIAHSMLYRGTHHSGFFRKCEIEGRDRRLTFVTWNLCELEKSPSLFLHL